LVLARFWGRISGLMASYLHGVAMALFYFAALRLYYFGPQPLLSVTSGAGCAVLGGVVVANLAFAWHHRSPGLVALALATGYATCLAIDTVAVVLPALVLLGGLAVAASLRGRWPALVIAGLLFHVLTYLLWAANNPLLGRPFHFRSASPLTPAVMLVGAALFGIAPLGRPAHEEDPLAKSGALLTCALGYGMFLIHTAAAFQPLFAAAHLAAAGVFLGLAVLFWMRAKSQVATFLYAMTGYAALSAAIFKAAAAPDVFVWLSLQSVVVVATAVWFRSRFIVVTNFLIGLAIVLGYAAVTEHETGISLGFGIVALVSARILNWQRDRLELRTELMRNAYLFGAFAIFPYALYHLAPVRYIGLAWVGLALFYYGLNLVVRNQKFRWMGHATLLLTTLFMVIVGTSHFEPVYRVLSFLALGTVMVLVSVAFARMRRRPRA
jgi:hypothetical protein